MEAGPQLPSEVYTATWWARFFAWERGVQNEFVQEAVETALGIARNWTDDVWSDIREAHDQGRVHEIPQPFDVRHAMALLSTNYIDSNNSGTQLMMLDLHERHPAMVFTIEGMTLSAWREIESLATQRMEREFAWAWGWRTFCWETEDPNRDPRQPKKERPPQFGKN